MDRARVLCPSISVVAHAAGAATLAMAPLLLPAALPEPGGVRHVFVPGSLSMTVGSGVGGGGALGTRPASRPPRVAAPAPVAPIVPEASLDLGGGAFIPGLPDGESGGGGGLCLSGCDRAPAAPTVEPGPAPEPAPPARVRVGGHVHEPRKTRHVAPVYPPLALAARVQGSVRLECMIEEDGRISDIAVVQGHPLLDAAAIEAVREWRYLPTLLNGVRVRVVLTVVVDFRLR